MGGEKPIALSSNSNVRTHVATSISSVVFEVTRTSERAYESFEMVQESVRKIHEFLKTIKVISVESYDFDVQNDSDYKNGIKVAKNCEITTHLKCDVDSEKTATLIKGVVDAGDVIVKDISLKPSKEAESEARSRVVKEAVENVLQDVERTSKAIGKTHSKIKSISANSSVYDDTALANASVEFEVSHK